MAKVKIAICQFELRDTHSFDEMERHLREQCENAMAHRPNLIVFPEFTTFGLLGMADPKLRYQDLKSALLKFLAPFTSTYETIFTELARKADCVIAAGSHWTVEQKGDKAFNVAHVFFPDGRIERQKKNHLFPGETDWGTGTHDGLQVFDIPNAKIGLMTCYDSEFPEVGRYFMLNGAQILLCSSATYTERGFYRIRRCCAARAVENQLYVVECHQVGALSVPVDQPFTAFGRSAILCPIDDRTMVADGVLIEADAGDKEAIIVGEVDLDVLQLSREASEATILKDRRPETYKKHYKLFDELVR